MVKNIGIETAENTNHADEDNAALLRAEFEDRRHNQCGGQQGDRGQHCQLVG